jgi:hypothetical protein
MLHILHPGLRRIILPQVTPAWRFRMAIQQTVEIPASHRLTIDVPQEVPAGKASILLFFDNSDASSAEGKTSKKWTNPLLGLAKDSKLTVERFVEMQWEDIELENELDKRRLGNV